MTLGNVWLSMRQDANLSSRVRADELAHGSTGRAFGQSFFATIRCMQHPLFSVAVVVRRVALDNRWVSHKWDVVEVCADVRRDAVTREAIGPDAWLWRGFTLDL